MQKYNFSLISWWQKMAFPSLEIYLFFYCLFSFALSCCYWGSVLRIFISNTWCSLYGFVADKFIRTTNLYYCTSASGYFGVLMHSVGVCWRCVWGCLCIVHVISSSLWCWRGGECIWWWEQRMRWRRDVFQPPIVASNPVTYFSAMIMLMLPETDEI